MGWVDACTVTHGAAFRCQAAAHPAARVAASRRITVPEVAAFIFCQTRAAARRFRGRLVRPDIQVPARCGALSIDG